MLVSEVRSRACKDAARRLRCRTSASVGGTNETKKFPINPLRNTIEGRTFGAAPLPASSFTLHSAMARALLSLCVTLLLSSATAADALSRKLVNARRGPAAAPKSGTGSVPWSLSQGQGYQYGTPLTGPDTKMNGGLIMSPYQNMYGSVQRGPSVAPKPAGGRARDVAGRGGAGLAAEGGGGLRFVQQQGAGSEEKKKEGSAGSAGSAMAAVKKIDVIAGSELAAQKQKKR